MSLLSCFFIFIIVQGIDFYELLVMAMKPYLIKLWHCFWAKLVKNAEIWFFVPKFVWFFRVQNVRYFCTDGYLLKKMRKFIFWFKILVDFFGSKMSVISVLTDIFLELYIPYIYWYLGWCAKCILFAIDWLSKVGVCHY